MLTFYSGVPMNQELSDWLDSVVSPERKQLISDTFEYLTLLHGYEIDSVAMNITNSVGRYDTYQLMDRLNSDLMMLVIEAGLRYGVQFDAERLVLENQAAVNGILATLTQADRHEDYEAIIAICSDSENAQTTFAEIVEFITDQDALLVGSMVSEVVPELVEKILESAIERKERENIDALAGSTKRHRREKELKELVSILGYGGGVMDYIADGGNLTLSWAQSGPLKELIAGDLEGVDVAQQPKWLAAQWLCLAYLTGLFDPRVVKAAVSEALDVELGDIKLQIAVGKELDDLLKKHPME